VSNVTKLFIDVIFTDKLECLSLMFSLMFVGMARSLTKGGAPGGFFTRLHSSLILKQCTRLERLARDKNTPAY
jgi:hypothetical protein